MALRSEPTRAGNDPRMTPRFVRWLRQLDPAWARDRRWLRPWLACLLLCGSPAAWALDVCLASRVDLAPQARIFEDLDGQLDAAQVLALPASRFQAATPELLRQ